jgi:hypothetical protein
MRLCEITFDENGVQMVAVIVFSGLKNIIENEAEGKTCDGHSPFEIVSVQQCLSSDLFLYI